MKVPQPDIVKALQENIDNSVTEIEKLKVLQPLRNSIDVSFVLVVGGARACVVQQQHAHFLKQVEKSEQDLDHLLGDKE